MKPKFVLPVKEISLWGWFDRVLVMFIVLVVLLIPLQFRKLSGKTLVQEKVVPVQILFDVSLSMAADDIAPSRFDAAKSAVMRLLQDMEGYEVSVISFSGAPFVYIPFSSDQTSVLYKWEQTTFADFPPDPNFVGTAIGDALILAIKNMANLEGLEHPGVIILITDGDSNMGYDPEQVIPWLQQRAVPVFVLGVGEHDYLVGYDYFDTAIKTSINVPLLQTLAAETGGKFYRVLESSDFVQVFDEIFSFLRVQEKDVVVQEYRELNDVLWVLLFVLLPILLIVRVFVLLSWNKK